jgi:hypothetical protein
VIQAMQYDYLDVARGFIALRSKYLLIFSLRSGSRYVVGDIMVFVCLICRFIEQEKIQFNSIQFNRICFHMTQNIYRNIG